MSIQSQYTLTGVLYTEPSCTLHRGYRKADNVPVIIKLLNNEYPSPREVARLRHDYGISKELDAPGVVRPLALEKTGHGVALVLEDFGGRPLAELLAAGRLEPRAALSIAAAVAEALGGVHDRHVIHKDIRPSTIFVNTDPFVVKLADFGVATRLAQETYKDTSPAAPAGTLAYMSPEQTGRVNRALDDRTDLYSLGVTLYEMFTGALPFAATDPMELVHSQIARTPAPPHEIEREIPEVVSAIVMKLLAKAAEDRYQSAYGLKADLEACLERWSDAPSIAPFPLGRRDAPRELRIAQRLYGREAETAALLAAFERARAGGAELLLVSGYAGVGKSTLVNEVQQATLRHGGRMCAGKFDQRSRNIPYTAVAAALRELCRHLLAEPEEALEARRHELLAAVGSNGQLLIDLIPELARVIGPQPPVPEVGPTESQNRFNLVFQSFLRVFTAAARPLVLFLDDLQWADPASLKLLSLLLLDPEGGNLLVIGAYRDHEVAPDHLLSLTLDELRRGGPRVSEIALRPLSLADVARLIADTLGRAPEDVAPLSRIAFEKTDGNPFFLSQILKSLHADGLIFFDREAGAWAWDLERIRAAEVTDNVVELMAGKIARLPQETQRVLSLAACIGHQFDLRTLALISETRTRTAAAALWVALREGLVLPLGPDYRFLAEADGDRAGESVTGQVFEVGYRFLHDRVQQAAYSLIEARHKQEVHLRIGRLLRDQRDAGKREDRLFAFVDHLNLGAALIQDRRERLDLAEANVAAGKRAKAATAYEAALGYLDAAAALLDETCWEEAYPLTFTLHLERAGCAYLNGHFEEAEAQFGVLLAHAKTRQDRAQVYRLCILLASSRSDFVGAIRAGRAALSMYGIDLPETVEQQQAALDDELAALAKNLAGRPIASLADAPLLTDPDHRAPLELLTSLGAAMFFGGPLLNTLAATIETNRCILHGRSDLAAYAYTSMASVHIGMLGRYDRAGEFFALGRALDEQFNVVELTCKTNVILASSGHSFVPYREVLPLVAKAQRAALQAGDFLYLSFTCYHDVLLRICAGEELRAVHDVIQRDAALARRTRSALATAVLVIARQLIAALEGRTRGRASLSDDVYDEAAHLAELSGNAGLGFALSWLHSAKAQLSYLYGDPRAALAGADLAMEIGRACGVSIFHYFTELPFYAGLALAALYPSASPEEQARYRTRLTEERAQIAFWAELCPDNFRHKDLLLAAEAARIAGDHEAAEELYEQAIDAARDSEATHLEALANELAARHYLARGRKRLARPYLNEAYHGYLRWGATAKASELAERTPDLLSAVTAAPPRSPRAPGGAPTGEGIGNLDAAALVRTAQAIASEIDLEKLLDRLMRIVVEHAGADRAALLLPRDGRLVIEATMTVDPDVVRVGLGAPLEGRADLAVSVVKFVERSMEPVVLGDAAQSGAFAGDPYLRARPPKSLLCLSMTQKGRVAGILYLENHAARDAFTPSGVEVTRLLSSHAAIAVENALLVAELTRRTEALERELYEREQAEISRAALKGELLRVQTPFIPITDHIVVMPLIGAFDGDRALQVLETALYGVKSRRARVVILDVTGVKGIDAEVTSTLLRTTRALRLLGAQVVITGIRPEMAIALVELGVDLRDVAAQGTLQAGIAYAMARLSREGRGAKR